MCLLHSQALARFDHATPHPLTLRHTLSLSRFEVAGKQWAFLAFPRGMQRQQADAPPNSTFAVFLDCPELQEGTSCTCVFELTLLHP